MTKKVFFIILLVSVTYFGVKYWPTIKGIYKANAPSRENITQLIPSVGQPPKPGQNNTNLPLIIPDGYSISIYAKDLGNPRDMILDPNGTILVSITGQGKVVATVNGQNKVVASGLNKPHGLAFNGTKLYIAETDQVAVYDYNVDTYQASNKHKIIDLPGNGFHFTRSILIKDGHIYVATGSDCNVCSEKDPKRAAIWVANLDGSDFKAYATGLRNSVFLTTNPNTNEIWATNMGRDYLGDNLPPDTINIIKEGANYGWPYCYGNRVTDNETNPGGSKFNCSQMEPPKIEIQAHSAPLGLAFLGQDLLVTYHGSWNRSVPTGYKIVKFKNGSQEDFITGWLQPNGNVLGRPVDILVKNKDIYISDDKAGVIYVLKAI